MIFRSKNQFAALILSCCSAAHAAPTPDQVKQLGTTLTSWGAAQAGNKEGTNPEYTGGLVKPLPDPKRPGWRPNPFPDDKPLFVIDAKNMDKYADKLSEGVKAMLTKYPTFRMMVYTTRRSAAYPQHVLDNTVKNATRCALVDEGNGIDVSKGCRGGFPFPIPKDAYEVYWNHNARYVGTGWIGNYTAYYVKSTGEKVVTSNQFQLQQFGFYDDSAKEPTSYFTVRSEAYGPGRVAGQNQMFIDSVTTGDRRAWSYQPSTRRVRLAPDLAADTPVGAFGGATLYDEAQMFSGKPDRFDLKLVGKKEMFIPYNAYNAAYPDDASGCTTEERLTAYHQKPECVRWELHRVWHVQATLKAGKRHVYSKRDFYWDEDTWYGGLQENFDPAGKIHRVIFDPTVPGYDLPAPGFDFTYVHDLNSGVYTAFVPIKDGIVPTPPLGPEKLSPDLLGTQILK